MLCQGPHCPLEQCGSKREQTKFIAKKTGNIITFNINDFISPTTLTAPLEFRTMGRICARSSVVPTICTSSWMVVALGIEDIVSVPVATAFAQTRRDG